MTLVQQDATAQDATFRGRVQQSVYRAATQIVGEDSSATGFSDSKTAKRHVLGVTVLSGQRRVLESFFRAVATQVGDVADPATIIDGDIDTMVDSVWDDIAGVKYSE